MFTKRGFLAILAIASTFACFKVVSSLKHEITSHNLTRGDFVQDKDFVASPGLVYGSCHDMATHGDNFEAKCTFVMETNKRVDSAEHLRSCDYNLKTKVEPGEHLILKHVVALSEDKAVVVFESYDTYHYFVLHFAYEIDLPCKGFRVETDGDIKAMVFAPQDDKFELVTMGGPSSRCENYKKCRLIVDTHGRIYEAIHGWLINDHSELIAVAASPFTERLVVDNYYGLIRLYTADHLGLSRLIREDRNEESGGDYDDRRLASMTYELVSVCTRRGRTLTCAQYNLISEKLFETELMYTQFSTLNLLNVHNLPGGGLLLVLASCSDGYSDFCDEDVYHFYVTKIDARGKQVETLKVKKPARVSPEKLHFFESSDRKMCLSHVFNDWRSEDSTVVDVFRFSDEDFNEISEYQGPN